MRNVCYDGSVKEKGTPSQEQGQLRSSEKHDGAAMRMAAFAEIVITQSASIWVGQSARLTVNDEQGDILDMKKVYDQEVVGVLSLSLILTSAYAVSGCLPAMLEEFSSYSRSSVELLLSLPSFAMMLMIALSPLIARWCTERCILVAGLLIYTVTGVIPVFFQSYPVIFAARILMGVGTGLLNAKAVTMIGERFSGSLQSRLQGIRCSMETLGQAVLTLIAGQLLVFGWNMAFAVYGVAIIILFLYLRLVPERTVSAKRENEVSSRERTLAGKDWKFIWKNAALGFLLVSTNVSLSLRIPSYVLEQGIGTASDGSTILGIATFAGFAGGILFGRLKKGLGRYLLPASMGTAFAGFVLILFSNTFFLTACGAALCGFAVTCGTSYMFDCLPAALPQETLTTANAVVLVGCNLGSFTAPFVLKIVGLFSPALSAGFVTYGGLYLLLAVGVFFYHTFSGLKND